MKACGTYDDVDLILRLYDLRREEKMRQARAWFAQSFHASTWDEVNQLCPPGSDENAYFRMLVTYWDMAASFVTGGVLQAELFFHSGRELLLVWERIRDVVPQMREQRQDPTVWENLEKVATDYAAWMNRRAPGSHEAFAERVRARPG